MKVQITSKNTSQTIQQLIDNFLENYFPDSKKYWREEALSILEDIYFLSKDRGLYISNFYYKYQEEFYALYDFEEDRLQYEKIQYDYYKLDIWDEVPDFRVFLENIFDLLFLNIKSQEFDFYKYKLEDNHTYKTIKEKLKKNIEEFLSDFSEIRTDICLEVLERSLEIPLKEVKLKEDFLLFSLLRNYDNIEWITSFSSIDSVDAGSKDSSEGAYAILKLKENKISSAKIIKEFIKVHDNENFYDNFSQISSFEAKKLLRQMATFEAKYGTIEQRYSSKQAKQLVSDLMQAIGMNYEFFTDVKNVENPFHKPAKVVFNENLYSGADCISFFAIGENELFFFQQTWNFFGE